MADLSKMSDQELLAMYQQLKGSSGGKPGAPPRIEEKTTAYNTGSILNNLEEMNRAIQQDPNAVKPGPAEAIFGNFESTQGLANAMRSGPRQMYSSSQDDILDSLLYLATGAAYNKEQYAVKRSAYKIGFTDKPEQIASKQRKLRELVQDAKQRSGGAWTPELESKYTSALGLAPQRTQQPATASKPSERSAGFSAHTAAVKQGRIDKSKPFGSRANPYVARSDEIANRLPRGSYVYLPNGSLGVVE
jgi:hypothetical protein